MVVVVVMGRVGSDLQTVGGVWGGLYVMLKYFGMGVGTESLD